MRGRFRSFLLVLSVLVLSVAGAVSVVAQSAPITTDEPITGTLDANHPFLRYDFTLEDAAEVTITLESSEFDAYVLLEDADGAVVAEDDDSAGRLNAQIVTTLEPGDYFIIATSLRAVRSDYALFASGDFELTLAAGEAADGAGAENEGADANADSERDQAVGDAERLFFGEAIAGELTDDAPEARYALVVESPVEATITLETDEFDAYLLLEDADGTVIAEDDDSGGLLNAQIVTVLDVGEYTVVATSLRTQATGEATPGTFTLSATADVAAPDAGEPEDGDAATDIPAAPVDGVVVGDAALDSTVEGELSAEAATALYTLNVEAPVAVEITLESEDFDAYLLLYDENGEILAEDDDGAGLLNAQIVTDLAAGNYIIAATSLRAYRSEGELFEAGAFTLTLATAEEAPDAEEDSDIDEADEEDGEDVEEPAEEPDEEDVEEPADDGVLAVGDTISGELTDDALDVAFPLTVEVSQQVTITLTSDEFDPYLLVLDADNTILAEDDDSAGSLDSRIEITLQPGTYTVVATSFSAYFTEGAEGQVGAFTLTVSGADTPEPADPGELTSVAPGETVESSLTDERPFIDYVLDAEAGTIVTVALSSSDFDTYLQIIDSAGEVIASNDDDGGNLNSLLTAYVVPEGAPVRIRVTSYGAIFRDAPETGFFVLRVTEPATEPIVYGETIEGALDEDNILRVYTFTGTAGDIVTATLETDSSALFLELRGDGVDSFSSGGVVGPLVLPNDGEYAITVSTFDLVSTDNFALTLETVEPQQVAYDEGVVDDFAEGRANYYTFEGAAGDIIDITVNSGETVDTLVRLIGPSGGEIAFNDDGGDGFDPEISGFELFEDGTYSVIVEPYIAGDDGEYTLTVASEAGRSLDGESFVIRISDKQFAGVLSFEGVAGEIVTLVARPLVDNFSEPRVTVTQDGETLASNSVGQVGSLGITFEVREDGQVLVMIEDFNGNPSVIEFTLVRVESP